MKKKMGILFAMTILIGIPLAVKASELSEFDDKTIKSYGSIVYEDVNGSVRIYAEDVALLQEKLASIPDEIFDPVLYSHTHVWEYINITEQNHTKHCKICGSKYDVVNPHTETEVRNSTISFDGQDYEAYEKVCECGYRWEEEMHHNLVYTPKDETCHTVSCALNGTPYCTGMEAEEVLHGMVLQPTDDTHHKKVCDVCGYQGGIEACVFELEEEGADARLKEKEKIRKYCACGNYITESEPEITDPGVPDPGKLPETSVSGNDMEKETSDMEITEEIIKEEGENNL